MGDVATIAVIGCGMMGRNHARVVAESRNAELAVVIDNDRRRAQDLARQYSARAESDFAFAAGCDAAIVATPTESHFEIASALLAQGVPVLVEKPLTPRLEDARRLVDQSADADVVLMCGLVERFNPAFVTASGLLSQDPVHVVAVRHSPAAPRIATHVVHDLLIHDIDLVLQLAGPDDVVEEVVGHAGDPLRRGVADVADCVLRFRSGLIATLSASRASHRKLRDLMVNDSDQLISVDLLRQNVDVYRHVRHELVGQSSSYRQETIHDIPFVRRPGEPLALQFDHFLALIEGKADPDAERKRMLPAHEVASRLI